MKSRTKSRPGWQNQGLSNELQALVKARGDGLGFDLAKAEFHFEDGIRSDTATVWIDGKQQARWDTASCVRPAGILYQQASMQLPPIQAWQASMLARSTACLHAPLLWHRQIGYCRFHVAQAGVKTLWQSVCCEISSLGDLGA